MSLHARVGLFERLDARPRTIAEVADALDVTARAAEAVTAVVAALKLIEHVGEGQFALTTPGRTYCLPSSPFAGPGHLYHPPELATLREAFHADGPIDPMAVEIAERTDEKIRSFIDRMHEITLPAASSLARQSVFSSVRRLLDVGGGSGSLM